jgi:hypothetical protein
VAKSTPALARSDRPLTAEDEHFARLRPGEEKAQRLPLIARRPMYLLAHAVEHRCVDEHETYEQGIAVVKYDGDDPVSAILGFLHWADDSGLWGCYRAEVERLADELGLEAFAVDEVEE